MNCRTFQKQLEDYLEDKLDFAGRFGMERHAQQCIHCGEEMAGAQALGRMVRSLDKVKAPPDFEASILNKIAVRKRHRRFSAFRRFLVFGFDMPSWRKYALASSSLALIGLGFLYWSTSETVPPAQEGTLMSSMENSRFNLDRDLEKDGPPARPPVHIYTDESDYGDYMAIGNDNLPMIVPLPNTIRMQADSPSEEYYIMNVSH